MENQQNKGLFGNLLGDINTNVGITQTDITKIGVTLFVTACMIILAYFTFKKLFS